jgi:hypothetical protein
MIISDYSVQFFKIYVKADVNNLNDFSDTEMQLKGYRQ